MPLQPRYLRRRLRPACSLALALAALIGCADPLPPPAEPDGARQALTTALDTWQSGEPPDALASREPPLRILDRDWSGGSTLIGYKLKGDGHPLGPNVQQTVTLNLKTPRGKALKKTVNYVIGSGDPPVIARQDIDE